MSIREYLATLPEQPLAVRRRFAVIGTTLSFVLLVLLWLSTRTLGRRAESPAAPSIPSATPVAAVQEPAGNPRLSPGAPAAQSSGVNLEGLSADLLKALGPSRKSP